MHIQRVDSATVLVDKIMFKRSDPSGEYLSFSPECTEKHIDSLSEFLYGEIADEQLKANMENLRGRLIYLN